MSQQKTYKGRWTHINDFKEVAPRQYIYVGKLHRYKTDGISRVKALLTLWTLSVVIAIAVLFSGCVTVGGMLDTFYVMGPYAMLLFMAFFMIWTMCRLSAGGDPLRDYVYRATVAQFKLRGTLVIVLNVLLLVGESIYLLLHGTPESVAGTVIFYICIAVSFVAALFWRVYSMRLVWQTLQ